MKQIIQSFSTGQTEIVDAPAPAASRNSILVDTKISLISSGTERMLVDFGKANILDKARQQPDKVKQVFEKVRTDGLISTVEAVKSKLDQPIPMGYCNVGTVAEVGAGIRGLSKGDRVVSNGPHADVVRVPQNLCARIPDNVSDDDAAFVVVGAIGLQGIRLAQPTLGEAFVVIGVGLIGLLTVQLLRAHGCRVLAIDFDAAKLELAQQSGAEICNLGDGEDPVAAGLAFSRGNGVDGVVITASTKSSDPVTQAAHMCRKRGRIVLTGVTGLHLSRADFYEKELSFQVSCSYGPGRYDSAYEEGGQDYPFGFVRWTEQRNFEAVLDMMANGQLDLSPLVSHRFPFEKAIDAYALLSEDNTALGIVLDYDHEIADRHIKTTQFAEHSGDTKTDVTVGFVGAGNYASRMLIPAFKSAGAKLHSIASSGGVNGVIHGRRNGFAETTSDTQSMISDPKINTVVIATRHNNHAALTIDGLQANKDVFVEKPLAMTYEELAEIEKAYAQSNGRLMVGFNRRFAPQVQIMKKLLGAVVEPKTFVMVMNAGSIPADHWTQDPEVGGGRIIGEACHYIDLMRFLAGSEITSVSARRMGNSPTMVITEDKAVITIGFADGSFGTIHYLANGGSSFPKERIEIFAAGGTLQLDNFLRLKGFGWRGFKSKNLLRQNKGQVECASAFVNAIKNGDPFPIAVEELFEVARVTLDVATELRNQS